MSAKRFISLALVAFGLSVFAFACGGGEEEASEPEVRVVRGLAAAGAGQPRGDLGAGGAESGFAFTGAPVSLTGVGGDLAAKGGGLAPAYGATFLQQSQTGINVQGFGAATVPASSARLQLFITGNGGYYEPRPEPIAPQQQTLTEADLQPIVDAIVAQGVNAADIEVTLNPGGYYDPYSPGRASITASFDDPTRDLQAIIEAARAAADASDSLFLESANTSYSASPEVCETLERESMQAAVEDAAERAQLLAQVLGVNIGSVVFATHYSYSPYGPSACDPSSVAYPEQYGGYYDPNQPAEVTLTSNVSVTYAIP